MGVITPYLAFAGAICVAVFFGKFYQHRSRINNLRKQGMPMPKWNWLTGHINLIYAYTSKLPPLANVNLVFPQIAAEFADTEMFLIDLWPVAESMVVVCNPEAAVEVTQKLNLAKHPFNRIIAAPVTGGESILGMNGAQWKTWRALFNPGFSSAVIAEQTLHIVDLVQGFCENLEKETKKTTCFLDDLTSRLTFDVIMKVTLDADANHQGSNHVLAHAMNTISRWHSVWDVFVILNPMRPMVHAYYGYLANKYVRNQLDARFEDLKQANSQGLSLANQKKKSVVSLAIDGFLDQSSKTIPDHLDEDFAKVASQQIRLFIFAGNDTTSSTICFTYHLLSKNPSVLERLQKEHREVFGEDTSEAGQRIKQNPTLLNSCPYTVAVVKETLRLYAPAATMRQGSKGTQLRALNGTSVPVDDLAIVVTPGPIHRNARIWPDAEKFVPERWLVGPEHELYPPAGAYRPFEIGPRSCIGQNLTMSEIKIVLIMTARTYKITPAYEQFDRDEQLKTGLVGKAVEGVKRMVGVQGVKTWEGDRCYPTDQAGAHPSNGYPCRVQAIG